MVVVDPASRVALDWWYLDRNLLVGVPLDLFVKEVEIYTEASKQGWGTCLDSHSAPGMWSQGENRHINVLEMTAVLLACQSFTGHLEGRSTMIYSDITTVVAYINRQRETRLNQTSLVPEELHQFLFHHRLVVRSHHIAGILITVVHHLSRMGNSSSSTEWSLLLEVITLIWDKYHGPLIDLIASQLNYN